VSEPVPGDPASPIPPGSDPLALSSWRWRGHRIVWTSRPNPDPGAAAVVLIHGFGASTGHWRHNLPALAPHCQPYALDLLGFGASDKPRSQLAGEQPEAGAVRYCFDLWGAQVADFIDAIILASGPRPVHLIGNSIGGVVALAAARLLVERGRPPAQVVLIDCAQRTLDEKRVAELPPWERAGRPLLRALVRERWLLAPLFRLLARPQVVRRVLRQAYPSGSHVDDDLVALLLRPQAGLLTTDEMASATTDRCRTSDIAGCAFTTGFGGRARVRFGSETGTNLVIGAGFTRGVGTTSLLSRLNSLKTASSPPFS
jgi:pimeloyl-ACP methyl ester carboxylesterase